jgi:hypothetical protein
MSLLNGGSGFPMFAPVIFEYISGHDVSSIEISTGEVPDYELRHALVKVPTCYIKWHLSFILTFLSASGCWR